MNNVTSIDDGWYRDVTRFAQHTRWLDGTMSLLTVALLVVLAGMVVWAGYVAWRRGDRVRLAAAAWTVIGTGISVVCGLLLKQVFREARPCLALQHVTTVQACPGPTDYSFPSDHTIVAAALAAGLWLIGRRLGAIGTVLALVEGFSRVYLGQHYPHDVVAAMLLSSLIVFGGWRLASGLGLVARVTRGADDQAPATAERSSDQISTSG
jgi:membrane-associated phospholipid phosphatase